MNNTEFSPQNTNPNNQDSGWNQLERLPRTEKIKQHPAYRKVVGTVATLAVGAVLAGSAIGFYQSATTPQHSLEELNQPEYTAHRAAQITTGENGVQLQVVQNNVDGKSGPVMANVGKLKGNMTFRVGHYATTAEPSQQAAENNAHLRVVTLLRDDIPEEALQLDGVIQSPEPFFQVVIDTDNPDIEIADLNE